MEDRSYQDFYDALNHCEEDSEEAFEIYKEMVAICENGIKDFRDDLEDDGTRGIMPLDVDSYAAPMHNLSLIYMKRGEYAKALHLLEQVLPMYRILEIYDTQYTYQRCYALKAMAECLDKLGKDNMATLCYYELKHLQLEVLEPRETAK
ncbi:MAG: tetratricopeptide repeat protein [Prevotella sp.]|nr:tetratricopeptide repeat protein [Prevotella sp.]